MTAADCSRATDPDCSTDPDSSRRITSEPSRPRTAINRNLLIAVFAVSNTTAFVAMIQILPVILDSVAADLGVSRTVVAGASTVSTLMGALAAFPIGRMLDRRGGRLLMTAGSVMGVAGVVIWAYSSSATMMYGAFVIMGFALAASTYDAAFAVIVVATEHEHRDRTILAVTMIAGLSTYLVYPVLGWLNSEYGWRTALVILAVVYGATAVPGHLWAIPSRAVHVARVERRVGVPFGQAWRQRKFWLLLIAFVAQAGSVSAFLLLIVTYLSQIGHSLAVATAIPITIGAMQISSRLAMVTLFRRYSVTALTTGAFALQAAGLLILPLVGLSIPLTVLCVAFVGIGQGVGVIARPSILADHFGVAHFASVAAAISVPMALARAGSPLMGAWLGDWRFLVICGACAVVAAIALTPLLRVPPIVEEEAVDTGVVGGRDMSGGVIGRGVVGPPLAAPPLAITDR